MKKLALFLITILLTSATVFTLGQNRAIRSENYVRYDPAPASCNKREVTEKEVQFILEITGSDCDGFDIDAVNPTETKWDCTAKFTLRGKDKKEEGKSFEVSKESRITVSNTGKGRFNAGGEAGLAGKDFEILSFSVSCS